LLLFLQIYPEIEPRFIHHFFDKLKKKWYIMKNKDIACIIDFNNDYENPYITKGWNDVKLFFNIGNDVEVKFSYYPPNRLGLESFTTLANQTQIPSFHSRSLKLSETCYFDIKITKDNIKLPNLVVFLCNNYEKLNHIC
jgi:hypothetical protein